MSRPNWQRDWSWWERFKYNWIPRTGGEWGCVISIGIMGSFALLIIVLAFLLLLKGIGWAWPF